MFGDGLTHGSDVSSNHASRCQFFAAMTLTSAPILFSPLKRRASSPTVIPCRIGIGAK